MIWNRILKWFKSNREDENVMHDLKTKQSMIIEKIPTRVSMDELIENTIDELTHEQTDDTTEETLLVPWRKLYTSHIISMQVHHYDWVDELDNWIQGAAWVQEYNGFDNYYEINTLDHSKKELEIEEFDDKFHEWQIDEQAKLGSP